MTKRGKVLRDPLAGPGLLIAEGRQYQFVIDAVWKSETPAKPGLVVNIDFNEQGKIAAITVVPDCQLAKEQVEVTIGADRGQLSGQALLGWTQSAPLQVIVALLLILSWFFLTAVSIEAPLTGTFQLTFWQLLRYLGPGAYGSIGLIAVTGPFVHHFWKDRQAALCGVLPLFFFLLIFLRLFRNIDLLAPNRGVYQVASNHVPEDPLSAFSLGLGTYISILIGVYFAFWSVKQFRQSKQTEKKETGQLENAAA